MFSVRRPGTGESPCPLGVSAKNALRDYYHSISNPDEFTRLQGFSYGLGMKTAEPYPAFLEALEGLLAAGWQVWIISHRTRHPILGPKEDLHAAAQDLDLELDIDP